MADGVTGTGNGDGVLLSTFGGLGPSNNTIGGTAAGAANIIAFSNLRGVEALGGSGNAILTNSIFSGLMEGIKLSPGANNNQAAPALTGAFTNGATITINGTLSSAASTAYRVEFFDTATCGAGSNPQGKAFLGASSIVTNGAGSATFSRSFSTAIPVGHDANGDGYSDADELTPTGSPNCTAAFPPTGGLGLSGLSSTSISAPCPGRPPGSPGAMKARADIDLDGQITIIDLSIVAGHFLESANPADPTDVHWEFDQDGDGQMTIIDLSIMAGTFLQAVPPC
jgi:hypothetical protein